MHFLQPRPLPLRIYEPNIVHNPFKWFGIWTPHGWRVHDKRWGKAERFTKVLTGDGLTTFFPEALLDPTTGRVGWQDDLHLKDDSLTDSGIYPCDPRVEYPPGTPRWAISHTLLCYPVADHNLYTHEYTWDMTHGHLQTHFHEHVHLEECRTDSLTGTTVRTLNTPISLSIEGNVRYPIQNSAVRGVWLNPQKTGRNLYTRRVVQKIAMHNAIYAIAPHTPVVQCHGIWRVLPEDKLDGLFDVETGLLLDRQRVIEQLKIPLDEPKLGLLLPSFVHRASQAYEGTIAMMLHEFGKVDEAHLEQIRNRRGLRYEHGKVGYSARTQMGLDETHYQGYGPQFDVNTDGVIDEADVAIAEKHLGREVRLNTYLFAYFGGDWLTAGVSHHHEHPQGLPAIADYEFGAGYDSQTGVVRLLESPGPDKPVWIEYHYDRPAAAGEKIVVHGYREST